SLECYKNQSTGNKCQIKCSKLCIYGICSIQNVFIPYIFQTILFCRCQKGYSGDACDFQEFGTKNYFNKEKFLIIIGVMLVAGISFIIRGIYLIIHYSTLKFQPNIAYDFGHNTIDDFNKFSSNQPHDKIEFYYPDELYKSSDIYLNTTNDQPNGISSILDIKENLNMDLNTYEICSNYNVGDKNCNNIKDFNCATIYQNKEDSYC
ncbi:hypothetical protein HZS_5011, partial [Henneguya salminicola]